MSQPTQPPAPPTDRDAGRWLSRLYREAGGAAVVGLALPLMGGALLVAQAAVLAGLLQRAVAEGAPLDSLLPETGLVFGLIAGRAALGFVAELASAVASEGLKLRLRRLLFERMLARGPLWTAGQSSGALSTAVVEQVEALDGFFARYMPAMVQAALLPVAFAVVAFPIDWVVGLLFVFTAPLIPVFMALAGWGAEAASRAQATALSRLTGRFADRLRGIVTLKLFGRDAVEQQAVFAASEEHRVRSMRVMRIAFLSSAVLEFFAALGVAGVALYVGLTFLDLVSLRGTELTLSAGLFCLLMAPEVYQPLRLLAAHYHDRAAAKAAAHEIARLLGELPTLAADRKHMPATQSVGPRGAGAVPAHARRTGRAAPPASPVAITARNLTVASPDGREVIVNADLTIAPGASVALLGPSGIGKSTLLEGVARLRPFAGELELAGVPLADLDEAELRRRVAVLGQRPRIFAGTIADNIRLGRPEACDGAVRLAAERALVTAFADSLPDGLAIPLGENGIGLSGGEIQRVALARIYLRNPDLLLLDEPTAHLDSVTEAAVLDGLLAFAAGRTLLVATHSAAVAARVDTVLRLAGGKLLRGLRPARPLPAFDRGAA